MIALNVLMGFVFVVAIIASIVLWIIGLIGAGSRNDLKNNKWLWLLLIIFVNPIGLIVYFFMEDRKNLGIWTLVINVAILILIPLYAIGAYLKMQA